MPTNEALLHRTSSSRTQKNLEILRIIATQGMWRVTDGVIEVHSKAD